MSKSISQFGKLYKNLVCYLIFIWLIFFIFGIIIFGINSFVKKITFETDRKLYSAPLILHFSSSLDSNQIIAEFKKIDFLQNIEYKSAEENISKMSEKFGIEGLKKWISKDELNDFLILYINAKKFSADKFQKFITEISEDKRFESIDFDGEKILLCGKIKKSIEKYELYLLATITLIALVFLSFIRFFMRYFQKEKWKLWKSKGLKLYKFQHFVMELLILIFALFISFGFTLIFAQNKLQIFFGEKVFSFHSEYFAIFCLFGSYIIISLINLISKKDA